MIQETVEAIEARLIATLQSNTTLYDPTNVDPTQRGLTSPSQVAAWRNFLNVIATEIYQQQQVMNLFEQEVEAFIAGQAAGTNTWLQQKVLEFQYSATVAQIIQFVNFAPQYLTVDETLRIITQCAVVNRNVGGYTVKIAANLAPISVPQYDALSSYLAHLNFGVPFFIINSDPDFLMLDADIIYDGQYSPVIQQDVTDAINDYIQDFNTNNFNGNIVVSKLQDVIQSVPGVIDVRLKQVEGRKSTTPVASATKMVDNAQVLLLGYSTYAGYIIIDTTAGRTLADTLNFIVQ